MTFLAVPFLYDINHHTSLATLAARLGEVPLQRLEHVPWPSYSYHPKVFFAIAYGTDAIFIQYTVHEKNIRAVNNTLNSPVYQDSCVEFFISFDDERAYYNFEFNCIGATLLGYGADRNDRHLLPTDIIRQIKYRARIDNDHNGDLLTWQLTLSIPFTAFHHHTITSLHGRKAFANFYKCGDGLPDPHFVTWSNIQWPEPNFHVREYFGELQFAS